ncbi:reductive dehalogenase [Dehalogenimonas sp. WBC-2]|nr:reductive dehalogenase [Dehalogenimonas sp. WBC-2]
MNKFHSSVSRRDFMKGLGMAGAGIGAASLAAPVFNDLDELTSSAPGPIHNYPWFVKELDQYDATFEHDWSKLTQTDERHTIQCSWQGTPEVKAWMDDRDGAGTAAKAAEAKSAYDKQGLTQPRGWAGLRNMAYRGTFGYGTNMDSPNGFMPPAVATPTSRGIPRWEGTPEENSQMIKAGLLLNGACDVAFHELDDKMSKFIFTNDFHDGKPYLWEDVEVGYETGETGTSKSPRAGKRVLPKKAMWAINYSLQMSNDSINNNFSDRRYGHGRVIQRQLQGWLSGLGYVAHGPLDYTNNFSENVAFAVLGGVSEVARWYSSISPTFGSSLGVSATIVTDLPLAPTYPIDAGIHRMCFDCMKCAEVCPGGAISRMGEPNGPIVKDPTWDALGPWNRWSGRSAFDAKHPELGKIDNKNGYKGVDEPGFMKHWWFSPCDCNLTPAINTCGSFGCGSRCVFANGTESIVHSLVKTTVAVTPIFNSFFKQMDGIFGYPKFDYGIDGQGVQDNLDQFWNNQSSTPIYGINTLRGGGRKI